MKKKLLALLLCGLLMASALVSTIHAADDVGDPAPTEPAPTEPTDPTDPEQPGEGEDPADPEQPGEGEKDPGFNLEAPVSLTITLRDPVYGNNLTGFTVYLWKVADIDPLKNNGTFNPSMFLPKENFKDVWEAAGILETAKDWDDIATQLTTTLRRYIYDNSVPADEAARARATRGNPASVTFTQFRNGEKMTAGLYLIRVPNQSKERTVGDFTTTYNYRFQPALVMLPGGYWDQADDWTAYNGGMVQLEMEILTEFEWSYESNELTPKVAETEPETTPTPPPPPTPPEPTPPDEPIPDEPVPNEPPEQTPPDEEIPEEPVPLIYPPEEEIPEEPTPLEPPPEEDEEIPEEPIPLTGLLWWPVPVLGVGGLGCIGVGSILVNKGKDDEE